MILITGANGHLGTATIDFLLQKNTPAAQIAALVRDASKATHLSNKGIELRIGDYFDKAALTRSFRGIDTLVFISSGTIENRVQQQQNVVDAAKAAGVKHIIYTSFLKVTGETKFVAALDHLKTEEFLRQSGIPYTVLRNTFYVEVLPMFLGNALETGQWYYAAGNAKANFASRVDMAEALANVALHPAKHANNIYEIAAGKSYSFSEIADVLSKVAGKKVSYIPIPVETLKEGMKQAGVPDAYIPMYASIAEAIGAGELDSKDGDLENILQRKPADLKDYLPQVLNSSN